VTGERQWIITSAKREREGPWTIDCGPEAKYFDPKAKTYVGVDPAFPGGINIIKLEQSRAGCPHKNKAATVKSDWERNRDELNNPPPFKNYRLRGHVEEDWRRKPDRQVRVEGDQLELVLIMEREAIFAKDQVAEMVKREKALQDTIGNLREAIEKQSNALVETMEERDHWKASAKKTEGLPEVLRDLNRALQEKTNRISYLLEQIGMWEGSVKLARQDERRKCWETVMGLVKSYPNDESPTGYNSLLDAANAICPEGEEMI